MLSEKPWRTEAVIRLLLLLMLIASLGAILVSLLNNSGVARNVPNMKFLTFVVLNLVLYLSTFLLTGAFLREHQIGWAEAFGFFFWSSRRAIILALLVVVAVLPIAWGLGEWSARALTLLHMKPQEQQPVQALKASVSWDERIVFGILAILLAPVVEELLFRGILYPMLKRRGYPRLALWGTSLLFAVFHSNLPTLIPLTFLAIMLTFLYEETNTLFAPILTHSLFNAANFYWLLRQQGLGPSN